jgi:hypothetical protein
MKTKVAIVVPSGATMHAGFVESLVKMMLLSSSAGIGIGMFNVQCSHIDKARNEGAKLVMNHNLNMGEDRKFSHICFIDSDQTFPANALLNLLRADKKVIGLSSVTRVEPVEFTARDFEGRRIDFRWRKGIWPVAACGFSFMLIKVSVFELLPFPWFSSGYIDNEFVSEDEKFCKAARQLTHVYVDADLSNQVGHIGTRHFTVDDIQSPAQSTQQQEKENARTSDTEEDQ